jgi:hypothetical protein
MEDEKGLMVKDGSVTVTQAISAVQIALTNKRLA